MTQKEKYKWWLHWLKGLGVRYNIWKDTVILDPKSWKVYYDEGMSIPEAIHEDLKNA